MRDGEATGAGHPLSAANARPQKWIVYGAETKALKLVAPVPIGPRPAVREVPNGSGGKAVAKLLHTLAPDSVDQAVVDYPDLKAATASVATTAGDHMTLTVQRMSRPVALESLTFRQGSEGLSDLPTGSQLVTVNDTVGDVPADGSSGYERIQIIVGRSTGVFLTLTVVPLTTGRPIAVANNEISRNALSILDERTTDTLLGW
jgi:hypothetical protein